MKNFDEWNEVKKKIAISGIDENLFFYEREIWWIRLGQNIGTEENGKGFYFLRPVLILKKHNQNCFLGVSLTGTNKDHPYYFTFVCGNVFVSAILSQIRFFDCRRLVRKIDTMKDVDFEEIKNAVSIINLGKPHL